MKSSSHQRSQICRVLFRLASSWLGDAQEAMALVESVLKDLEREHNIDHWTLDFFLVGKKQLSQKSPVASEDPLVDAIMRLPESERLVIWLSAIKEISSETVARMMGMRLKAVDEICQKALETVTQQTGHSEQEIRTHLESILYTQEPLPSEVGDRLREACRRVETLNASRPLHRQPVLFAVIIGFLMVGVVFWLIAADQGPFPGSEDVIKLAATSQSSAKEHFEPVDLAMEELGDWLTLKRFPRFWIPSDFEKVRVVGVRILQQDDNQIAVLAVPLANQQVFAFIFEAQALGVELHETAQWKILEKHGQAIAITQKDGICFMLVVKGSRADMEEVLRSVR